jgi:excisionase family DNA binding protein
MKEIKEPPIVNVMTTADVMARLKVSRNTLYALIAKHLPNAARTGRDFRFIEADINTIWEGMRAGDAASSSKRPAARGAYVGAGSRALASERLRARLTKRKKRSPHVE